MPLYSTFWMKILDAQKRCETALPLQYFLDENLYKSTLKLPIYISLYSTFSMKIICIKANTVKLLGAPLEKVHIQGTPASIKNK